MQDAQVQAGRGTRAAGGGAAPGYQPSTTNTNPRNCVRGRHLHHTKNQTAGYR